MTATLTAVYRVRGLLLRVAAAVLLVNVAVASLRLPDGARTAWLVVVCVALAVGALALLATWAFPRPLPVATPHLVHAPVDGRWQGVNSPVSAVPSHGVRMYGQTYAIDLVADPADGLRPSFGTAMMRDPREYPAFGRPVRAMIDGTVVRASDRQRDHRARSNRAGFAYMMAEGALRELGGAAFVVGNHVTIRGDDGVFAVVAHLRRGSITVGVGDRVRAGDIVGSCGNSGNSSEPHVHAQLMDRRSFWTAQGVPMAFRDVALDDGDRVDALPANGRHMTASA